MGRASMWELAGAEFEITFPDTEVLAACVEALVLDGHGHHFAVIGEGTVLACSPMAVGCLIGAELLPKGLMPKMKDTTDGGEGTHDLVAQGARAPGEDHDAEPARGVGRVDDPGTEEAGL